MKGRNQVKPTISPAIDILVPYNWERILYYISGGDTQGVSRCVNNFETTGHSEIPEHWMKKMNQVVSSYSISQQNSKTAMKYFYEHFETIIDPHTAVAAAAVLSNNTAKQHGYVCLSTAAPYKFSDTMIDVLGISLSLPKPYRKYESQMKTGENWEEILRNRIITISNRNKSKL